MIVVKLMGGLGNQMLQYAAGYALADRLQTELLLDLHFYSQQHLHDGLTPRQYELHLLGIEANWCNDTTRKLFEKPIWYRKIGRSLGLLPTYTRFDEPHFHYANRWEYLKGNVYLNGYWSSYKYFSKYKEALQSIFLYQTPGLDAANAALVAQMKSPKSVSLHVRRGDYVSNASAAIFHGLCSPHYYQEALQCMKSKLGETLDLYIFSDDPDWVKEHLFENENYTLVRHNTGQNSFKDLLLMASCKHHILANSSFSWWGAWLGAADGIQIAPKQWFLDTSIDTSDLCPPTWIRM